MKNNHLIRISTEKLGRSCIHLAPSIRKNELVNIGRIGNCRFLTRWNATSQSQM